MLTKYFMTSLALAGGFFLSGMIEPHIMRAVTPAATPVSAGPDIATVIATSIQSINRQSKLVVLESRMTGVATATRQSMGMTAKQTDIESDNVQYALDMTRITANEVHVTPEKIEITLPRAILSVKRWPIGDHQTYTNDSWLFTLSDTGTQMAATNNGALGKSLQQQADALIPNAQASALSSLSTIFSIPLQAAHITKPVVVRFS